MKILTSVSAGLAALVPFAALAPAQGSSVAGASLSGPAALFPDSTYVVVEFAGLDALANGAASLDVAELLGGVLDRMDPDSREQTLGGAMREVMGEIRQGLLELNLTPEQAHALLSKPVALAIGRPVFFDNELVPSFAVAFAGDADDVDGALARFEGSMTARASLSATAVELAGVPARCIRHAQRSGEIVHGRIGPYAFAGNSSAMFADCASRRAALQSTAAATSSPVVSVSLRTSVLAPVLPLLQPFLPYGFEQLFDVLGVEDIGDVRMDSTLDDGGSHDRMVVEFAGSTDGILKACMARPADLGAATWCSPDTVLFGSMSMDLLAVSRGIGRIMEALPAQLRGEIVEEMERELGRELGMNLAGLHQIVASFGTNVSLAVEMTPGQVIPAGTLFVDVSDPQMVQRLMAELETVIADEAGVAWKDLKIGGGVDGVIRYTAIEQLRLGYTIHAGRLVICSDATKLRATVRRFAGQEESLAGVASFQEARSGFVNAGVLFHSRMDRAAELGWPAAETGLRPLLDSEDAQREGLSAAMLPQVDEMARALGAATFAVTVDAKGVVVEQRSNLGAGALLSLLAKAVDETFAAMAPRDR